MYSVTLPVFPDVVTGVGWRNLETVRQQNVDADSLYQDFSGLNSAYLDERWDMTDEVDDVEIGGVVEQTTVEDGDDDLLENFDSSATQASSTGETGVPAVIDESAVSTEEIAVDSAAAEEVLVTDEPNEVEATETVESDEAETVSEEETVSFNFRSVTDWFSFAQATDVVEESESQAVETIEESEVVAEVSPEAVVTETVPEVAVETDTESTADTVEMDSDSDSEVDTQTAAEPVTIEDSNAATSSGQTDEETTVVDTAASSSSTVTATTTEASIEIATELPNQIDAACEGDCLVRTMDLSGFGIPIDEERQLVGAQLRLSFAAKLESVNSFAQSLGVRYSFDNGATWGSAGEILWQDETANSINGGYFLFALPQISDPALLDSLQIQLTYDDDIEALEKLFVESLWLELLVADRPDIYDTYSSC